MTEYTTLKGVVKEVHWFNPHTWIKVGSTIGVRCHQLRDGSSGCLLGFITLEGAAEKMFD